MRYEEEIHGLAAETGALQAIVGMLCLRLAQRGDPYRIIVLDALDDAMNIVQQVALQSGKSASPMHIIQMGRIVESLHDKVLQQT